VRLCDFFRPTLTSLPWTKGKRDIGERGRRCRYCKVASRTGRLDWQLGQLYSPEKGGLVNLTPRLAAIGFLLLAACGRGEPAALVSPPPVDREAFDVGLEDSATTTTTPLPTPSPTSRGTTVRGSATIAAPGGATAPANAPAAGSPTVICDSPKQPCYRNSGGPCGTDAYHHANGQCVPYGPDYVAANDRSTPEFQYSSTAKREAAELACRIAETFGKLGPGTCDAS
jgi:hypothetical protein